MLLSVVIPVHNSERTIGALAERLFEIQRDQALELILVDDGSRDGSSKVCEQLAHRFPGRVRFVELARNFGEHNAVMAGLAHSRGDWVLVMDDDLQNAPEDVQLLVKAIREGGYDVVYSKYPSKMHAPWRNAGSWVNNLCATVLLKKPYDLYLSSFKIMSKFAVEQIVKYQGPFPYIDGLLLQSVDRIGTVIVPHQARAVGKSSYTLGRLVGLWLNTFTNFSVLPLRLAFFLGLASVAGGMCLLGVLLYEWWTRSGLPVGYLSVMTSVLVFSGLILVITGVIGEYTGRVLLNINGKPQFVIRRVVTEELEGVVAAAATGPTGATR